VVSLDSAFIDNADAGDRRGKSAEQIKQDGERKALARLLPRIKKAYPQLCFVLALDSLYGCGPVFALAQQFGWSFVVTFKEGRTPGLGREFQALLPECPENVRKREWADGRVQEFRWVRQLDYADSAGRRWQLNALQCPETTPDGPQQYFAWLTGLPVGARPLRRLPRKEGAIAGRSRRRGSTARRTAA